MNKLKQIDKKKKIKKTIKKLTKNKEPIHLTKIHKELDINITEKEFNRHMIELKKEGSIYTPNQDGKWKIA